MKTYSFLKLIIVIVKIQYSNSVICGCKIVRGCYKDMVDTLIDRDEEKCVEDASIGVSTVMIFLKAIQQFCPDYMTIYEEAFTYEGRHLYEVVLNIPYKDQNKEEGKPIILIDAGQQAGTESVGLALFIIEQMIACEENAEMISRVKWVILPSTNPDGMEYGRYNRIAWKKNVRPSEDTLSYGVDISRNFDYQWAACDPVETGFSPEFPGLTSASENETIFIKNAIARHKKSMKMYISIRRDGHALLYPYAYSKVNFPQSNPLVKIAANVAAKVNQRAGGVQIFINESIYDVNGKTVCGSSVDYTFNEGVELAYELRVFIGRNNRIMTKFQQLPRGYEASLRHGYFAGIRELYNNLKQDKKLG